jgi:hypothetical protein
MPESGAWNPSLPHRFDGAPERVMGTNRLIPARMAFYGQDTTRHRASLN